jgi:hypothetical protein
MGNFFGVMESEARLLLNVVGRLLVLKKVLLLFGIEPITINESRRIEKYDKETGNANECLDVFGCLVKACTTRDGRSVGERPVLMVISVSGDSS